MNFSSRRDCCTWLFCSQLRSHLALDLVVYWKVDGDGFIVVKKGKKNVKNDRADSAANDVLGCVGCAVGCTTALRKGCGVRYSGGRALLRISSASAWSQLVSHLVSNQNQPRFVTQFTRSSAQSCKCSIDYFQNSALIIFHRWRRRGWLLVTKHRTSTILKFTTRRLKCPDPDQSPEEGNH